jgi:hypothetical protein
MAAKNVNQFLEQLLEDSAFRAAFRASASGKVDAILDFALSKGFTFSEKELMSALASFPSNPTIDHLRDQLKVAKAARPAPSS